MKSFYISFSVMLTNLIVALIVVNLGLFAYARLTVHLRSHRSKHSIAPHVIIDPSRPQANPVLAQEMAAAVMLRNYDYDPITQLRLRPMHGRYVNIEAGGFRRVRGQGPWPLDKTALNIFVFGGSTTFGMWLDDDDTIPSFLQQSSRTPARRLNVYNFGRPGYTSTQELLLYLSLLRDGSAPDVAVFIDGLNECQEWSPNPPSGAHWPDEYVHDAIENAKKTQNVYMLLVEAFPIGGFARSIAQRLRVDQSNDAQDGAPDPPHFIVNRWLRNKKSIEVLSRGYGVKAVFVWQPVAAYKYDLRYYNFPRSLLENEAFVSAVYPAVETMAGEGRLGSDFLNLAEIQQNRKENLYVDGWHYNAAFSSDIASQIFLFLKNNGTVD